MDNREERNSFYQQDDYDTELKYNSEHTILKVAISYAFYSE